MKKITQLILLKKKYYNFINKFTIKIGDIVVIYQYKGKFRYIFNGIILKKKLNLFNYNITLYNNIKKNKLIKIYNLYSNSIKNILIINNIYKMKRNNLYFLKSKYIKI